MDFRYNEETGTAAIEKYVLSAIRNLIDVKGNLTISIQYQSPVTQLSPPVDREIDLPIKQSNELLDTISVKELKDNLKIGLNQAYELVRQEKVKSIRIGRRILIIKSSVHEWMDNLGKS